MLDVMDKRINPSPGNVRILINIPIRIKIGAGISSLRGAADYIMHGRICAAGLYVWIAPKIPFAIEVRRRSDYSDIAAVPHPKQNMWDRRAKNTSQTHLALV